MTREEAIERLKNYTQYRCGGVDLVAINMAIQALESQPRFLVHSDGKIEQIIEPCDDCVSRQAVIDEVKEIAEWHSGDAFNEDRVITHMKMLPPVLPKREQGKWSKSVDNGFRKYKCSKCHNFNDFNSKYCPHCGAEMKGVEEWK